MDTVRRPLCGCFVLSCMVGGIFRKPLGFRRCLPPARPEKARPFQAGRSPCTKHQQTVRLRLYEPKKVFEGSKGRFFKNAPWQGVGRSPTKREQAYMAGYAFSGGTKSFHETPTDRPASPLRTEKSFWGFQGAFFQKRTLGRGWDSVPQRENSSLFGRVRLFRRDEVLSRNAHRSSGLALTHRKKFLGVPRGVFSKTHPWQGVGQGPTKRRQAGSSGHAFSGETGFRRKRQEEIKQRKGERNDG